MAETKIPPACKASNELFSFLRFSPSFSWAKTKQMHATRFILFYFFDCFLDFFFFFSEPSVDFLNYHEYHHEPMLDWFGFLSSLMGLFFYFFRNFKPQYCRQTLTQACVSKCRHTLKLLPASSNYLCSVNGLASDIILLTIKWLFLWTLHGNSQQIAFALAPSDPKTLRGSRRSGTFPLLNSVLDQRRLEQALANRRIFILSIAPLILELLDWGRIAEGGASMSKTHWFTYPSALSHLVCWRLIWG